MVITSFGFSEDRNFFSFFVNFILFFFLFSSLLFSSFSIVYKDGSNFLKVQDFNLINSDDGSFILDFRIDASSKLNDTILNFELLSLKDNSVLSTNSLKCISNICSLKIYLDDLSLSEKYVLISSFNLDGNFYQSKFSFVLNNKKIKKRSSYEPIFSETYLQKKIYSFKIDRGFLIGRGSDFVNLSGLLKTKKSGNFIFEYFPKSNLNLRSQKSVFCSSECRVDLILNSSIVLGDYMINIYSLFGESSYKVNVDFLGDEEVNENSEDLIGFENSSINFNLKKSGFSRGLGLMNSKNKNSPSISNRLELALNENIKRKDLRRSGYVLLKEEKIDGSVERRFVSKNSLKDIILNPDTISATILDNRVSERRLKNQVVLRDFEGNKSIINNTVFFKNLNSKKEFRNSSLKPGIYERVLDNGSKDFFAYGLVTVNSEKPLYTPGEVIQFIIVVLDSSGYPLSSANVSLTIKKPDGNYEILSSSLRSIVETTKPGVYTGYLKVNDLGRYDLEVEAFIDGYRVFKDSYVNVVDEFPFDILRDVPATIDPWQGPFLNNFSILPRNNFSGSFDFEERVPEEFSIVESNFDEVVVEDNYKILKWFGINSSFNPFYISNVPLISPNLYELGLSKVFFLSNVFYENRSWLFAIDPLVVENYSIRTCTDTFGFNCGDWPSSSEGDNTFDTCPSSIGNAGDENVVEVTLSSNWTYTNGQVQVSCDFDPYSSGSEEYIYYYNTTGWKQLYSGNPADGNVHTVTVDATIDNAVGTHYFRCIIDWDGESDSCANQGNYYDNDDVSIEVRPSFLVLNSPENLSYPTSAVDTDISTSEIANISYRTDGNSFKEVCTDCTSFVNTDFYSKGSHTIEVIAISSISGEVNKWIESFYVESDLVNPPPNSSENTCSNFFGFYCGDWPSSSEGDNTFDTCPSSIGNAGDENVVEVFVNSSSVYFGSSVNVTCSFDPYSSGSEEYIYYYNMTGWRQLYSGNPVDGNIHNVSASIIVDNVTGTHYFRCIIDWDGENDFCANQGSYYDNDDVGIDVLEEIVIPFSSWINSPQNLNYTSLYIYLDFASTLNTSMEYSLDGAPYVLACSNCTNFNDTIFSRSGDHTLTLKTFNVDTQQYVYENVNFTLIEPTNPPVNYSDWTCTDAFGFNCGDWPSSSEGDNTFDTCPSSIGNAGDENVVEAIVTGNVVNFGDVVNVTCVFDPYSSGTEEYIYYYNTTGWRQLYSGNPVDGNIHNVTVTLPIDNVSGMHYFRCIADWDGENDFCADQGSYYDNDDVNVTVLEPIVIPFILSILNPLNATYNSSSIFFDFLVSKNSILSYSLDSSPFVELCSNCTSFNFTNNLLEGTHFLEVNAIDFENGASIFDNVTFSIDLPLVLNSSEFLSLNSNISRLSDNLFGVDLRVSNLDSFVSRENSSVFFYIYKNNKINFSSFSFSPSSWYQVVNSSYSLNSSFFDGDLFVFEIIPTQPINSSLDAYLGIFNSNNSVFMSFNYSKSAPLQDLEQDFIYGLF